MKKILGLLVTAFMLTASAMAADLDTPQIGAAVCAPEEADGSVVLHEAPDGRSETLMRYFQGAPLQVLDLADGWAHAGGLYPAGTAEIRRGSDAGDYAIRFNAGL